MSRCELFIVLKENNALAVTFKSSVDIALKYVKEKLIDLVVLCSARLLCRGMNLGSTDLF